VAQITHKNPLCRFAQHSCKAGAHLIFLSPYSRDLNPMEQLFAKLKYLPRDAAEQMDEATWQHIASVSAPLSRAYYHKNAL